MSKLTRSIRYLCRVQIGLDLFLSDRIRFGFLGSVYLPSPIKGWDQIFRIYLKKIKLDDEPSYYSQRLVALTPGFAGADIANVLMKRLLLRLDVEE
ncbi:hypothetical protein YC2023_091749 [Brassica napus]